MHRRLLEKAHKWQETRNSDLELGKEMLQKLVHSVRELDSNSRKDSEIFLSENTSLINGYRVWLGELIARGCECKGLNSGLRSRLEVQLRNLEHYEELYKSDRHLWSNEREHLHKQFLRLTQETLAILRRVYWLTRLTRSTHFDRPGKTGHDPLLFPATMSRSSGFFSIRVWIVYLILFVIGIPWYWPSGDERIFLGFPLWVVVTIAVSFVISCYTARLFWNHWPSLDEEEGQE